MSERRKRDVYIAIMVAAAKGKGLNLSWDECAELGMDDAVATRAGNGLDEAEFGAGRTHFLGSGWETIDPYRQRSNAYNGNAKDDKGRQS